MEPQSPLWPQEAARGPPCLLGMQPLSRTWRTLGWLYLCPSKSPPTRRVGKAYSREALTDTEHQRTVPAVSSGASS